MNTETPSPLEASIEKAQANLGGAIVELRRLASIAPELKDWHTLSPDGGLRLLQVFPSPALGEHTLHSQTSAMAILRALGVGARVDCDGAMRAELPSGWRFILHRAGSSFFVPAPQPGSAQ
jgi:hypothetical protein